MLWVDIKSSEGMAAELKGFASEFDGMGLEIAQAANMAMLDSPPTHYLDGASTNSRMCAQRIARVVTSLKGHKLNFNIWGVETKAPTLSLGKLGTVDWMGRYTPAALTKNQNRFVTQAVNKKLKAVRTPGALNLAMGDTRDRLLLLNAPSPIAQTRNLTTVGPYLPFTTTSSPFTRSVTTSFSKTNNGPSPTVTPTPVLPNVNPKPTSTPSLPSQTTPQVPLTPTPTPIPSPGPWNSSTPKVQVPEVEPYEYSPAEANWNAGFELISALEPDEMKVLIRADGSADIYLGGVADGFTPGSNDHGTIRDTDKYAVPAMFGSENEYRNEVKRQIQQLIDTGQIEEGADVRLWGHSFGAMTAHHLASDKQFNGDMVNVRAVAAAGYADNHLIRSVPDDVYVVSAQNRFDQVVLGEKALLYSLPGLILGPGEWLKGTVATYIGLNVMSLLHAGSDPTVRDLGPNHTLIEYSGTAGSLGHAAKDYASMPAQAHDSKVTGIMQGLGVPAAVTTICSPKVLEDHKKAPKAETTCVDN